MIDDVTVPDNSEVTEVDRQRFLEVALVNLSEVIDDDTWSQKMSELDLMLKAVYSDESFRHLYHGIYDQIVSLREESRETLVLNLGVMNDVAFTPNASCSHHFASSIRKLYDHVMLEVRRLAYLENYTDTARQYKELSATLENESKDATARMETTTKALNDMNSKVESLNTQSVTVLGIFSAIVLASFGGINVIASAVSSMYQTHFPKLIITILTSGFVMVNTVFVLMYFLGKLTDKTIYARCKSNNACECKERCCGIVRVAKRLPFMFWLDLVFIVLIIATVIFWLKYLPFPWYI